MAKILFEYMVKDKDGEEYILTERQKKFLEENEDKRFVTFPRFTLNPAYVVAIVKRRADAIIEMYPCETCNGNGYEYKKGRNEDGKYPDCTNCEGTGVDLKI